MSDQGLSIFDASATGAPTTTGPTGTPPTASSGSVLPTVRKGGYDPAVVDAQLTKLTKEHASVTAALKAAVTRVAELEKQVASLRSELANTESPTYASLGGRASALLRLAEEEASSLKEAAEREAAEIREAARKDTATLRSATILELEELKSAQHQEVDDQRSRILADAEQARAIARSEAADQLAAATREADQLRLAAQQETTELKTQAQREVEQSRAGADREVQEARRMLAVEKERLAREATDYHTSALAESRRLVEDAEARAASADERARQTTQQIADQRAAVQTEHDNLLSRARREAESLVATARAQAETILNAGNAEAERALALITAEVERISKRRDAITAQLASLSDLMGSFGKDDPEPEAPAETTAQTPTQVDTE